MQINKRPVYLTLKTRFIGKNNLFWVYFLVRTSYFVKHNRISLFADKEIRIYLRSCFCSFAWIITIVVDWKTPLPCYVLFGYCSGGFNFSVEQYRDQANTGGESDQVTSSVANDYVRRMLTFKHSFAMLRYVDTGTLKRAYVIFCADRRRNVWCLD